MNPLLRYCVVGLFLVLAFSPLRASDEPLFHETDPLANRDAWGPFHQMPKVNAVDYAYRHYDRYYYYFQSRRRLLNDPAYVGALHVALRSRGYYCGPIDGVMTQDVND